MSKLSLQIIRHTFRIKVYRNTYLEKLILDECLRLCIILPMLANYCKGLQLSTNESWRHPYEVNGFGRGLVFGVWGCVGVDGSGRGWGLVFNGRISKKVYVWYICIKWTLSTLNPSRIVISIFCVLMQKSFLHRSTNYFPLYSEHRAARVDFSTLDI